MSCLIVNGSPRGRKSNSNVMASWIKTEEDECIHLAQNKFYDTYDETIKKHQQIIFIYPLYVDAMPGIVKSFFEYLENHQTIITGKDILFIIHCGFAEAIHLRILERYHIILKDILSLNSVMTIITPGSEGVRIMPEAMTKKRRMRIQNIVSLFREHIEINAKNFNQLAGKETMSKLKICLFKILNVLGLMNIYWNRQLKKNYAFKKRYNMPYCDRKDRNDGKHMC